MDPIHPGPTLRTRLCTPPCLPTCIYGKAAHVAHGTVLYSSVKNCQRRWVPCVMVVAQTDESLTNLELTLAAIPP